MIPIELIRRNPRRLKYAIAYFLACLDPDAAAEMRRHLAQDLGIGRTSLTKAINAKLDEDFSLTGDQVAVLMRLLGCYDVTLIQLNLPTSIQSK